MIKVSLNRWRWLNGNTEWDWEWYPRGLSFPHTCNCKVWRFGYFSVRYVDPKCKGAAG